MYLSLPGNTEDSRDKKRCLSWSNREDSLLPDDALEGKNVWNIQQEKEDKDMYRYKQTDTGCCCSLPSQISFVPVAAIALHSPRSPLSSRPLLSLHSFFLNLSRFFNSACVWADVQKNLPSATGGRKFLQFSPGFFPHNPLPAFTLPLFLAPSSLLTHWMIDNVCLASPLPAWVLSAWHLQPCRETSSPRQWDVGDPLRFFSQIK